MKKKILILFLIMITSTACKNSEEEGVYADEVENYEFDGAMNNSKDFIIRDQESINLEEEIEEINDEEQEINESDLALPNENLEEEFVSSAEIMRLMEEQEEEN